MIQAKHLLGAFAALLTGACLGGTSIGFDTDGVSGCAVGAAGCVCTQGGGCDPGLACLDGTCISPDCGDGVVQAVEECDDANGENTDACTNACVLNVCGDGIINLAVEECDLGGSNDNGGSCKLDCTLQVCGDGFVGPGEECDHGAANGLDGLCAADCISLAGGTTTGGGTTTATTGFGSSGDTGTTGAGSDTGTTGASTGGGTTGGGPVQVVLDVVLDATVDDKNADANLGGDATLSFSDKDVHRILVQFDQAQIDAAAAGKTLMAATLVLPVDAFDPSWVAPEQINLHRGVLAWTENANWVCADDQDPGANKTTCPSGMDWTGGSFAAQASASTMLAASDTELSLPVTNDVQSYLDGINQNDGWVLMKSAEGTGGAVTFHARESMLPAATLILDLQ